MEVAQKFKENAKGKTYKEVYKSINDFANKSDMDKNEFWRNLILKNQKKRFGRIVDAANIITEKQKKKSRNSFVISENTMANMDASDNGKVTEFVLNECNAAQMALEKILQERMRFAEQNGESLVADKLAKSFKKMEERIVSTKKKRFEEIMKTMRSLQSDRYYDNLTLTKNYEYLSGIIPSELRKADKKGFDYAMISLDFDNLKAINETGGHKLGDISLMTASRIMQEELNSIPENLKNKIKQTGIESSVIRATGGEEFILTLPGLNSEEAREVFDIINGKMQTAIKNICRKGGYEKKIKNYIGNLDFQTANGKSVKRSADEIEKFGSATAGVISLKESKDYLLENGKLNAGKMRQIADMIGERLKNNVDDRGNSGRGKIWGIESI
ncbi:MAG: diguanylate cyclase [Parcubacteria group bacterium]